MWQNEKTRALLTFLCNGVKWWKWQDDGRVTLTTVSWGAVRTGWVYRREAPWLHWQQQAASAECVCLCVSTSLWCNVEKEGGSEASGKINTNSKWCQQHLLDLHFLIAKERNAKKKKNVLSIHWQEKEMHSTGSAE